jgi:ribosomal protein S18 acetylase RimI-like enzyme
MRDLLRVRPQTEDDLPFLFRLYASTREEELKPVPWTEEQKREFLEMQFRAQKHHYETHFPDCEFAVIEKAGEAEPIGRLYIDRRPDEIHIIDIALMPGHRGGGIGTMLLKEIIGEASASGRAVGIFVEMYNPALHLYRRLGFRETGTNGVYFAMRREPDAQVNTAS